MHNKFLMMASALALASPASAANILVNGGFEVPLQGPPNFAAFNVPVGSTLITGWNIVQGNVDLTTAVNYGPGINTLDPSSVQDIDLIGDSNGSGGVFGGLSQSFSTIMGETYLLAFQYAHNNGTFSPNGYAAQVTVADSAAPANTVLSTEVSQRPGTPVWTAFSQTFIANANITTLSFISTRGAFNAGIYLDNVSVDLVTTAVPEPGTWAMMLLGFGMMGLGIRRRQSAPAIVYG
jgi:hypothetical protein